MTAVVSDGLGRHDEEGRTSEVSTRDGTEVDGPVRPDRAGSPVQTRHASRHVRRHLRVQPMTAASCSLRGRRLCALGTGLVPLIVGHWAVCPARALGMLSNPALRWVGTAAPRTVAWP